MRNGDANDHIAQHHQLTNPRVDQIGTLLIQCLTYSKNCFQCLRVSSVWVVRKNLLVVRDFFCVFLIVMQSFQGPFSIAAFFQQLSLSLHYSLHCHAKPFSSFPMLCLASQTLETPPSM